MCNNDMWSQIVIGTSAGAAAGIVIWLVQLLSKCVNKKMDQKKVYNWLNKQPKMPDGKHQIWDLRTIASSNNLTDDRARYICSSHKYIFEDFSPTRDRWGIRN